MSFDIELVGVGGQGILTIGSLIAEAAEEKGLAVNFFPSKGMAQRGGFVKAQLRLGSSVGGPNIPPAGADLAVAMERSEALKAVRYMKPGADFVLYADVWAPTAVALGKAAYPELEQVEAAILSAGGRLHTLLPIQVPEQESGGGQANLFILGYLLTHTALANLLDAAQVERLILYKWVKHAQANSRAYQAGRSLDLQVKETV